MIDDDKKHHILGAQCNMWNEYNYTMQEMEYDIYPRIIAMAEVNWTPRNLKDYPDFERRLDNQRVRLDMHDVNYYIPVPEDGVYFFSTDNELWIDGELFISNVKGTEGMIETETENAYGMVTIYPDKIELEGKGRTQSHSISLKKD